MALAVTGRWRGVPGGLTVPGARGCLGLATPPCGAVGYGVSERRRGAGGQEAALMSARCRGETVSITRDAAGRRRLPKCAGEEGGAVLAHPDARGPICERPRARRLAARFGITYAMGGGQRRRAAARFWKVSGWPWAGHTG